MSIQAVLILLLTISLLINIVFFWYTRNILSKLIFVSENIGDLAQMIDRFVEHLDSIFKMELFYGDETLNFLLEHATDLADQLTVFEDIYMITEAEEGNELDDNEIEDEPSPETT
jgi:hypothetical protein